MHKNIYITGFYLIRLNTGKIDYWLTICGQYGENSDCVFINDITVMDADYNTVESLCRDIYCKYFNTDLNNIIGIFQVRNLRLDLNAVSHYYKDMEELLNE